MKPYEPKPRTASQNRALWKYYRLLAEELNNCGKDMKVILKPHISIPWTEQSVHDHLWLPIQKAMYSTESTTKLEKQVQIDHIHEVLMRELGLAHHVTYIPFPSKTIIDEKNDGINIGTKLKNDNSYPEYVEPTF